MFRPTYHEPHEDRDWDDPELATTVDPVDEIDSRPTDTIFLHPTGVHAVHGDGTTTNLSTSVSMLPAAAPLVEVKTWPPPGAPPMSFAPITVVDDSLPTIIIGDDPIERTPEPYVEIPIGQHPFENLSGTAGTGKTWMAKKLAKQSPKGSIIVAATTGIAAVNLADEDVETTTINSALKYFNTQDLLEKYTTGQLQAILRKHRRSGIRRIIIDEKSMMSGQQLTCIARAIDEVNTPRDRSLEAVGQGEDYDTTSVEEHPQMGITLVGDFGQLPPVPDDDPKTGKKLPIQFCFDSPEWARFADHTTTLTKIWRQDDVDFCRGLHAVRRADVATALAFFTPDKFADTTDDTFDGTTIFAKNEEVDRYNLLRLDRLQTPSLAMPSTRKGQQRPDWKNIPATLNLKEGALVMILSNHRIYEDDDDNVGKIIYANGDLGTVLGASENRGGWSVKLHRNQAVVTVCPIIRENTIPLEPGRKAELITLFGHEGAKQRLTEDGKKEIIGTVFYMPMRLAYGCTVHKTQGLTLDNVQVNIRDPFFRQPGMLFVALSRARTIGGLRIVGNQRGFVERCRIEPRVIPWL